MKKFIELFKGEAKTIPDLWTQLDKVITNPLLA
jgi:hypothetical protein